MFLSEAAPPEILSYKSRTEKKQEVRKQVQIGAFRPRLSALATGCCTQDSSFIELLSPAAESVSSLFVVGKNCSGFASDVAIEDKIVGQSETKLGRDKTQVKVDPLRCVCLVKNRRKHRLWFIEMS